MQLWQHRKKKALNTSPLESTEQTKFCTWLTNRGILHYAIPNGGKRSMLEALKFKAQGVQSGIPDLCIPLARKSYHGLYIELKRIKGGSTSESQQYWLEVLTKEGYLAKVCKGADEAILLVTDYLS